MIIDINYFKAKTHEDILNLVDAYSLSKNEIYFDRDPATFNCILNFYRTDRLHVLDEICILDFADDLEFWKIKELNLEVKLKIVFETFTFYFFYRFVALTNSMPEENISLQK